MSKGHLTRHSIEMYLCGNLPKEKLEKLKEKFKKNLVNEQKDLKSYEREEDNFVYQEEYNLYVEKNSKNLEVLSALKQIFPNDTELEKLEI